MRRQVARLAAGDISGQCCTSSKLRPHPLQVSSPWLVEQMAMHGRVGGGLVPGQPRRPRLGRHAWPRQLRSRGSRPSRAYTSAKRPRRRRQGHAIRRRLPRTPIVDGGLDVGDVDGGQSRVLTGCRIGRERDHNLGTIALVGTDHCAGRQPSWATSVLCWTHENISQMAAQCSRVAGSGQSLRWRHGQQFWCGHGRRVGDGLAQRRGTARSWSF